MLTDSWNPMKVGFHGVRTEYRSISFRKNFSITNNLYFGVIRSQPIRHRIPCDKINLTYPRGESFYSSKPVLQIIPIPKSCYLIDIIIRIIDLNSPILCFLPEPVFIIWIHPRKDEINVISFVRQLFFLIDSILGKQVS